MLATIQALCVLKCLQFHKLLLPTEEEEGTDEANRVGVRNDHRELYRGQLNVVFSPIHWQHDMGGKVSDYFALFVDLP